MSLSNLSGHEKTSLSEVNAGDFVVLDRDSWSGGEAVLAKVERVTKSMVVVDGEKFRRGSGRRVGDANDWMAQRIYALSQTDPWNCGRTCSEMIAPSETPTKG